MSRISRLSALQPLAISVTWGAGGSTKDRSLELASLTQGNGLTTILHLTCTNMEKGLIDDVLKVSVINVFFYNRTEYSISRLLKSKVSKIFSPYAEVSTFQYIRWYHEVILCFYRSSPWRGRVDRIRSSVYTRCRPRILHPFRA